MEIAKLEALITADIKPLTAALAQAETQIENFSTQGADAFLNLNAGLSKTAKEAINAATDIDGLRNAIKVLEKEQSGIIKGTSLWQLYEQELKKVDGQLETTILLEKEFGSVSKKVGSESAVSLSGIGKGLTSMLGSLRSIAYILPGIGLAGIFNLAFEAISDAAEEMGLFKDKTNDAEEETKRITAAFEDLETEIKNINKELGNAPTALEAAQSALKEVDDRLTDITKTFKDLNTEPAFITFFKGGGFEALSIRSQALKEQNELLKQQAQGLKDVRSAEGLEDQKLRFDLDQVHADMLKHNLELQKQINQQILSDSKSTFAKQTAALKASLDEQLEINTIEKNKAIAVAIGDEAKIAAIQENFRFANLKAQQDYYGQLNRLQEKQAAEALKRLQEEEEKRFQILSHSSDHFKKIQNPNFIFQDTGNPFAAINRDLEKTPALIGQVSGMMDKLVKSLQDKKALADFNKQLKTMQSIAEVIADTFADMFTELLTTGRITFKSLSREVAQFVAELVRAVIETAILQAIMAALSGGTSAAFGHTLGGGLAGLIPHGAEGGIISKPTLMVAGEAGTEALIPLNQLQNFTNGMGNNISISGQLRAQGADLVLVLNRSNVRLNRNYGNNFTN